MKTKYMLLIIMLSLASCALFKKTSKATSSQSSVKQMEMGEFLLKQANKETQIFTYWNDSGFYQIQHIKKGMAEANSRQLKAEESQVNKENLIKKNSVSVNIWVWMVAVVGTFIFVRYRWFHSG